MKEDGGKESLAALVIDVTMGGKTYDLRPTFGAIVRIEAHLGAGLGTLLMRIMRTQHGVADITRILYEGIVANLGNDAPEYEQIGESVVAEGLEAVTPAALDLLNAVARGITKFAADKAADGAPAEGDGEDPTTAPAASSPAGAPSSD